MFNTLRSIIYVFWLYGSIIILGIFWSPAFILPRRVTIWGMRSPKGGPWTWPVP